MGLDEEGLARAREEIRRSTGLPAVDVLREGAGALVEVLRSHLKE